MTPSRRKPLLIFEGRMGPKEPVNRSKLATPCKKSSGFFAFHRSAQNQIYMTNRCGKPDRVIRKKPPKPRNSFPTDDAATKS